MAQFPPDPTLAFRAVDLAAHLDLCLRFVIDATVCAFGTAERFHESDGKGAERHAARLRDKAEHLPGCQVHLWRGNEIIGQISMEKLPGNPSIGYVNLLYLVPNARGQGLGILLEAYAWAFLSRQGCRSLRLSASPTNSAAWRFYERSGWQDLGPRDGAPYVHVLQKHCAHQPQVAPVIINPDDYLETEFGREFTPERNRHAWALAYERLRSELLQARTGTHVYVVMGVQGAGKSRWVSENYGRLGSRAVVFDATLPARRHREKLLDIVRESGVPIIAVFIQTSLHLALSRNARRSADKRVPEEALRSVFGLLEPPDESEGFVWTQTVEQQWAPPTVLQTSRLKLVAPDVELAEHLAAALNASYELHQDFLTWSKPHWTEEEVRETLRRATEDFSSCSGEKKYFLLLSGSSPKLVGCIGIRPLYDRTGNFGIGYWVSQLHANTGLVKEALIALVSELSGYKLRITASSANIPSQRLAASAGFTQLEVIRGDRVSGRFGVCDTMVYQRAPEQA